MKQIFLLRHAKSDWSALGHQDFERPLAERGVQDASLMSKYIKDQDYKIDKVLCSTARRTKETFDICADGFNFLIEDASYLDELYFGEANAIISLIESLDDSLASILIVGHNPTIHILTERITRNLIDKYPTCALAEISLENSWKDLSLKQCKLKSFIKPKELRS